MTNVTDRKARLRDPSVVVEVFSAADLPDPITAPDGVTRVPLTLGVKYVIHNSFVWPRILVPINPIEGIVITEINSISQNVPMLFNGDSTPHFWGRDIGNFRIRSSALFDISNGGAGRGTVLFDLVGQGPDISVINPQGVLFLSETGIGGFLDMGRLVDVALASLESGWIFSERGLVVRSVVPAFGQILTTLFYFQVVPMTTPMLCYQGLQTTMSATSGNIRLTPTGSAFCVDSAATGTFEFLGLTYGGVATSGNFFRPDIAASITVFTNADIAFTSVQDSTINPGVDSTIRFAGIQTFVRGQVILVDGAGATYDGTHTIVRVSADQSGFDVNVTFAVTDTGNVKITRVTAVAHGLVGGETQTISGTTSYNQTSEILFRVDDDNFDIPIAFAADDATGTVSSTSKDAMTIDVSTLACGQQQDSKTIGGCHVTGGTNVTTLTNLTWTDFDLTGNLAVVNSNIQRWSLTDTVTGELTHDESKPFSGNLVCTITMSGFSSQDRYEFRAILNGTTHMDDIVVGTSTNQNTREITLQVPVNNLIATDTVRVQVQNTTGTDNIVIEELNLTIA